MNFSLLTFNFFAILFASFGNKYILYFLQHKSQPEQRFSCFILKIKTKNYKCRCNIYAVNPILRGINKIVDKIMPYTLILLIIIIVVDLFLNVTNTKVLFIIEILDYTVITIFVIDLFFLFIKSRDIIFFFKNYWLDIIAVFPFGLLFRTADNVLRIGSEAEKIFVGQKVLHEVAYAEKFVKFASKFEEASKIVRFLEEFAKFFRFIPKSINYIKRHELFLLLSDYFTTRKKNYGTMGKYGKI